MKVCPICGSIGRLIGKSIWLVKCATGKSFRLNKYKCGDCACKFVNSPKYFVVDIE